MADTSSTPMETRNPQTQDPWQNPSTRGQQPREGADPDGGNAGLRAEPRPCAGPGPGPAPRPPPAGPESVPPMLTWPGPAKGFVPPMPTRPSPARRSVLLSGSARRSVLLMLTHSHVDSGRKPVCPPTLDALLTAGGSTRAVYTVSTPLGFWVTGRPTSAPPTVPAEPWCSGSRGHIRVAPGARPDLRVRGNLSQPAPPATPHPGPLAPA